jgi:hypothetical protein
VESLHAGFGFQDQRRPRDAGNLLRPRRAGTSLAGFREVWGDDIKADVVEVLGEGDACVAVLRFQLRGVQSGIEVAVAESWAMWVVDGRIGRMEQYGTTAEALEAVGLEK